jgi:hypothetical protein
MLPPLYRKVKFTMNEDTELCEYVQDPFEPVTAEERAFCREYSSRGRTSVVESVRAAYPDRAGLSDNSLRERGRKLLETPKIQHHLSMIAREAVAIDGYSLSQYLSELDYARDHAFRSGQVSAAVRAIELKGRATGHDKEVHIVQEERSVEIIHEELLSIVQARPDVAKELAKYLGGEPTAMIESDKNDTTENNVSRGIGEEGRSGL